MKNFDRGRIALLAAGVSGVLLAGAGGGTPGDVGGGAFRERALDKLTLAWGPTAVEDVSRLNRTQVRAVERLPEDETAAIQTLRRLLRRREGTARARLDCCSPMGASCAAAGPKTP